MRFFNKIEEIIDLIFRNSSNNKVTINPDTSATAGSDVTFNTPPVDSGSDDLVSEDAEQTLTQKRLETPKINENIQLTSTATELNQLDDVSVGGNASGDILTTDDAQTVTGKSIVASQIDSGTLPDARIQSSGVTQHEADINHDALTNTHDLTTDIDHDTITNGSNSSGVHGVVGDVVGTNDAQDLSNKDINGGTASNNNRITLPKETKANLDGLTRKEATIVYATDDEIVYYDDGSELQPFGLKENSAALTASSTDNVFTEAYSGAENWIIQYSLKEATTDYKRVGQIYMTVDGTAGTVAITDSFASSEDLGVEFSADISGADVRLRYTVSGANNVSMKYFAKKWGD